MTRPSLQRMQRGFTLVEAIVVMVIIGILGGVVASFITMPVQNYADQSARAELSDIADLAVRRISRDLRLALPNSVRLNADGSAIQFLITKTGGRYLAAEDKVAGNVLDFMDKDKTSFDLVGERPQDAQAILAGDLIVVLNLGPGFVEADAYTSANDISVAANSVNVATVLANVNSNTVTLQSNPFAKTAAPLPSPSSRFHVLSAQSQVTYQCNVGPAPGRGTLERFSTPISAAMEPYAAGSGALLANRVSGCRFTYDTSSASRSGRVGILLSLQRTAPSDESPVELRHHVSIDNTP